MPDKSRSNANAGSDKPVYNDNPLFLRGHLEDLYEWLPGGRELAYNPEHHAKTKHIQRRHFFVRELVEDFRITVPFVRSESNDADFFTKPLKSSQFFALRDRIMNISS